MVDSLHVPILHGVFSGHQFVPAMAQMPEVEWQATARGVRVTSFRDLDGGRRLHRVTEAAMPTLRVVPSPRLGSFGSVESIGWVLPIDDVHFRIYVAGRVQRPGDIGRMRSKMNGKFWWELSEAEHRDFPGDYEAQVSQGPITAHSAEHLRTSDRGVALLRRFLREQLAALARGDDPSGVARGPDAGCHAALRQLRQLPRRMKVLLLTQPMPAAPYIEALSALAPELELVEYRSALADAELATIDIALGWRLPPGLAARMPRLGWVCSTAAGVEKLLVPDLAPHVVVSRIVDPSRPRASPSSW